MKPELADVQHVISQIKRALPPTTREEHKFLNNLAVLLDKNTKRYTSPDEQLLAERYEKLHERLLELCFLRKDLPAAYAKEFSEVADNLSAALATRPRRLLPDEITAVPADHGRMAEEESASVDLNEIRLSQPQTHRQSVAALLPAVFTQLRSAQETIEEALRSQTPKPSPPVGAAAQLDRYLAQF